MDVKDDYGDEGLGDDFDRALSETLATKEDDDREVNASAQGFADLPALYLVKGVHPLMYWYI